MRGIVVVTYNSGDHIGACLDACLHLGESEIVVVDNASTDNTLQLVRERGVRLIANKGNRGFAAAVNQGVFSISSDSVLLLNPDAIPMGGLDLLESTLGDSEIGAAAGQLLNSDGSPQQGFNLRRFPTPATLAFETLGLNRIWPSNPVNRRYRISSESNANVDVDQPAGAFLMFQRRAWKRIGGFDESFYPIWFEDVDFCKRLKDAGFRIIYVPAAKARHSGGHSAGKLAWSDRQVFWYGSLLRYACRHFSTNSSRVVSLAVILGGVVRMAVVSVVRRSFQPVPVYAKVIRLAAGYLRKGERG